MNAYARFLLVVGLLLTLVACAVDDEQEEEPPRPAATATVRAGPTAPPPSMGASFDKWSLWSEGAQLRGANIWQRIVVPELDGPEFLGSDHVGPPYTQADFDQLAALGANLVNISHPGLFSERPPYVLDEAVQANLDRLLEMAAQADLFAVISFRTGPGRSDFTFYRDGAGDWFDPELLIESVWSDAAAQEGWAAMWQYTAARYRDNPIVVGYDLMCEPNAEGVLFEIYEPDEFYSQYGGTVYDWNAFYPDIVAAIRQVDAETPILVSAAGWGSVRWLFSLQPTDDPRTVYTVHQYEPQEQYTHQEPPAENGYPGAFDLDWDGEADSFDRAWLDGYLSAIDDFQAEYGAPVAVNEYGVHRWVPDAAAFMSDEMDLFEQRGMNHALWVWDPAWAPWSTQVTGFNFRYGPDPQNAVAVDNELLDAIVARWALNTVRPSTLNAAPALAAVRYWFYLLDVDLTWEVVEQIAASEYDLLVLDFIPSEADNEDYPMAEVIAALEPRRVLAYIDIGEAEDYRRYWQDDWGVGDPEWIVSVDPDGWAGNYPVAYWTAEWQEIWLGDDGALQQILDAGFDGVYLDWIEAYSDENVIEKAEEDGVDAQQQMVEWVATIADFVHGRCPHCLVIGQNAAELVEVDEYVAAVDGIAQEQVWFDGGADNDPPGDCPLPRTEAEVDTPAYRDSLSPACRRLYNDPDSTLHVSSEEYLHYLTLAQQRGLPVLTVDYALEPENVAWVVETSRALGFVPFVGSRALDRYVEVAE